MWLQNYIYGVPKRQKFFTQYGSMMHKILQLYLTGELKKSDLLLFYLSNYNTEITAKAPSTKIYLNYLEQGRQYLRSLSFPARKILFVEQELEFQYAGHTFTGFLDLLSEDDTGALCLTDHKSRALKQRSKRAKPTQSDAELDLYLRQLYIYSAAVRQIYGIEPDFLEFNCFRTGTWIREPYSQERAYEVEDWAHSMIETITGTDDWFASLDFWFCKQICDLSDECEYEDLL